MPERKLSRVWTQEDTQPLEYDEEQLLEDIKMNIKTYTERNIVMSTQERILSEYNDSHKCCPKCGSDKNTQTLMAFPLDLNNPEKYKDENRVTCLNCGWKGIVHDLVP